MYSQVEINKINETIGYNEGKIFWKENKNWTSDLWEKLNKIGYKAEVIRSSFVRITDSEGYVLVDVNNGWVNALKQLSIVMR